MFRMERSGDYIKVSGVEHEVSEFIRLLRGCVLRGKPHDKVICKLAGKLDQMIKKETITTSFRLDNVEKYLSEIVRDIIPTNFTDLKFKNVSSLENMELAPNSIYGSKFNDNMEVFCIDFDLFRDLKPKFVPKDIDIKVSSIDEL